MPGASSRENQTQRGGYQRCRRGLDVHESRLTTEGQPLVGVGHGFGACVRVARASRGEDHSGLLARLMHTQAAQPERHEETETPPAIQAIQHHRESQKGADDERDDAHRQPTPSLAWPDVNHGAAIQGA